ncbi:SAM-dependent methyltransferase [Ideonella sp. DXS29W]|uniref:SAM-dependent methyltransferase n=1 Tax=Ideonella lacteola TaxID=2984193 RepID=A0ABU9BT66_9BURK
MSARPGRLVLMPNTLDLGATPEPIDQVLTAHALQRAAHLKHWVVESAKTARAFLKRVDAHAALTTPLQQLSIQELPRARKGSGTSVDSAEWKALLAPALAGHDIGLLSDAGLPAVADPGAALVATAHTLGLTVEPMAGASSVTLAVAASGLNGQRFAFEGYLPQNSAERLQRVRELEQRSRREGQTQLVIETPYRNEGLLKALSDALHPDTRLSVACGLTSQAGWCRTQHVSAWRRELQESERPLMPDTLPAVFMWLAG